MGAAPSGHPVLPDHQESVLLGIAPGDWPGAVTAELVWFALASARLQHPVQGLDVQMPYQRSRAGLHLLVDSTGIKFLGEGEWNRKKHGAEGRRQWHKHIGIDAQTLQIRAICVTSNDVSDAAVVIDLLAQVPGDETIASFTGDGTYDTQSVYEAVIQRGAIPIVPPRKRARIRLCLPQ